MVIKEIEVKNFKSFYDSNTLIFDKGLNLVSGHEGSGKSNLFDAFLWALFCRVSKTRRDEAIDEGDLSIVNDKIKQEVFDARSDSTIVIEVRIKIEVPRSFRNKTDVTYEIRRFKTIRLKGEVSDSDKFYTKGVWAYDATNLEVTWTDKNYDSRILEGDNAATELELIFPKKIRKYMWFQGEQLNELLDFDNEETLKQAISYISYLSSFEHMEKLIKEIDGIFGKRSENKVKKNNRNEKRVNEITGKININEKKLKDAKERIEQKSTELEELSQKAIDQESKLEFLAGYPELKEDIAKNEGKIKNLNTELGFLEEEEERKFSTKWMLAGTENLFEKAKLEMQKFTDKRLELIADNNRQLDQGIPGDALINKMLREETCLICQSEAKKGSQEFDNISMHLDKNKQFKKLDPDIEAMNDKVVSLRGIPARLIPQIQNIKQEIKGQKIKSFELREERNRLMDDNKELKEKKAKLLLERGHELESEDAGNIASTLRRLRSDINTINSQLRRDKDEVRRLETEMKDLRKELLEYAGADLDIVERELQKYTGFLTKILGTKKEVERIRLIRSIEDKANEIQASVAGINNVVTVYVKINPETYRVLFVDAEGNPNASHGAQDTLAQLSIISAIVKLSSEYKNEVYPFIADAPTSDFAKDFTDGYLTSVAETYDQSIIISKDVVSEIGFYKNMNGIRKVISIDKVSGKGAATSTNSVTRIL